MGRKQPGGTPAIAALRRAGVGFELRPYAHDPRATSYGLEAAAALGVDPARVFKTLMVALDGALVVGIVPVALIVSRVPGATLQLSVTVPPPAAEAVKVDGATGGEQPTLIVRSFVAAEVPTSLMARTRTKYWPTGTPPTARPGVEVGKVVMSVRPGAVPASRR